MTYILLFEPYRAHCELYVTVLAVQGLLYLYITDLTAQGLSIYITGLAVQGLLRPLYYDSSSARVIVTYILLLWQYKGYCNLYITGLLVQVLL